MRKKFEDKLDKVYAVASRQFSNKELDIPPKSKAAGEIAEGLTLDNNLSLSWWPKSVRLYPMFNNSWQIPW